MSILNDIDLFILLWYKGFPVNISLFNLKISVVQGMDAMW